MVGFNLRIRVFKCTIDETAGAIFLDIFTGLIDIRGLFMVSHSSTEGRLEPIFGTYPFANKGRCYSVGSSVSVGIVNFVDVVFAEKNFFSFSRTF